MGESELEFNRGAVRPMECLREGWRLIKEEYWLFFGITLIGMLLGSVAPLGLLLGPMMCGIHLCLLRREAGRRVTLDMLFKGFDYFAQSVIAILVLVVPIFLLVFGFYLVMFVGMIALAGSASNQPGGGDPDPIYIWGFAGFYGLFMLLLITVSLVTQLLIMFVFPLIVDRKLSGLAALRLSARAVRANLSGVLGVLFLGVLLGMVGALACFIGAYFVYPIYFAMIAIAYRQVFPAAGSLLVDDAPPPGWNDREAERGQRRPLSDETGIQTN